MNQTGEWLGFDVAFALSFPRDEIAGPQTIASGRTVFSASYDCGERVLVVGCRRVVPFTVLRLPEPVHVRLVADR